MHLPSLLSSLILLVPSLALPNPSPPTALLVTSTPLNTTFPSPDLRLAKRQSFALVFAYASAGCSSTAGLQWWDMAPGRGCVAVTNKAAVAWNPPTFPVWICEVYTWSGSNCQGSSAKIESQGCRSVRYASFSWVCDCPTNFCGE
ncbi:hypothetical protein QBC39DRAFT_397226 [Podospora conica]|nr:hypothetical protein QBC39DRAFT_397226 [Schizothecium conicum]